MERSLVPPTGVRTFLVPMAPPTSTRGIGLLLLATLRSLLVLMATRPRVTVATGGYASTPAAVASWLLRVPIVLFLPDVFPGKAVRWLAPLARRIAVTNDVTAGHFRSDKAVVTGYPIREAFNTVSPASARKRFNIPLDATVVCVFGGSQGARRINEALARSLPGLLTRHHVLHVCGEQRLAEATTAAQSLSPSARGRYQLYPYLHDAEMADALAAADLAVCRSGASVLGELPATATPAILIPLPQPSVHQRENAEYLADRGAAIVLEDEHVHHSLGRTIDDLLGRPDELGAMAAACAALARPNAAEHIVDLVMDVAS